MDVTNPILAGKDPAALEGMKVTLEAIDGIFNLLIGDLTRKIEGNARRADALRERGVTIMDTSEIGRIAGESVRWGAKRDVLVQLRASIPPAIIEGRYLPLAACIED